MAFEPGGQKAAVEGIAGAGGVDGSHARRRRGDGVPAAAARSELDDGISCPPARTRIECRFRFVHEDQIGRLDERAETGGGAQRRVPPEVHEVVTPRFRRRSTMPIQRRH